MPSLLATDQYQLTMVQSYLEHGLTEQASFEFMVRALPDKRNMLLACGLEPLLETLPELRITPEELGWLESTGRFSTALLDYLESFSFSGDVDAMPEGTPFFAHEPILRISAPLPMAQLVETLVVNQLHFPTLVASKALRMRLAAQDALLVDFGLRRTHGLEAGLAAARAGFIAGLDATSNMEAAMRYGIPASGTMAHSYVQAHASETEAFLHFARSHPDNAVLLIDTYDTLRGTQKAIEAAAELAKEGIRIKGVRIDSGDLADVSKAVRARLNGAGLAEVIIFASGNLDEWKLAELEAKKAPIAGFGIGTRMNTSSDAPYLDCAYKLQQYGGEPKWKSSEGKATYPGIKQVCRRSEGGRFVEDVLTLADDETPEGTPLLQPVMRSGKRVQENPSLASIRRYAAEACARLPEALRRLDGEAAYPVRIAPALDRLMQRTFRP